MSNISITDSLKTDIAHVQDLVKSPGGDIGTINGLSNLKRSLFHCLITVPGTLVHKPTYGVGVRLYQNAPSSFAMQQKLASLIQSQFNLDPRVQSVSSVSITSEDGTPQQTIIAVRITPVGYTELTMNFTPFNEANT